MKTLFIAAAVALAFSPAFAEDKPSDQLKIKDCETILQGLTALDGHQVVVAAGKPNETIALVPYEFGNASLRDAILKNLTTLKAVQARADANRKATFNEFAPGQAEVPVAKRVEYATKVLEIAELPCDAQLKHISVKSLLLGKNEIPGSVLQALEKILDD